MGQGHIGSEVVYRGKQIHMAYKYVKTCLSHS